MRGVGHFLSEQGDGYSIEDVITQIASGMDSAAVVFRSARMTAMENPAGRSG
jgi:hypothetical protein